jgi:alanine racemase
VSPAEALARLRPTRATIDLDRLAANYRAVAALAQRPVMPVVKANAYGHGAAQVGRLLQSLGAPMLAVAYVEEAVGLREAGVTVPIVVLAAFAPAQNHLLVEHRLTAVVSTPETLEAALETGDPEEPLPVHVKVDTGMSRLGFAPAGFAEAVRRLADSDRTEVEGVMTHLAVADEDAAATNAQLDRFDAAVDQLAAHGIRPRWIHAANSGGLAFLRPAHTLVRPGLLIYGIRPRPLSPEVDVRPVMTVSTRVALVKEVPTGTPVSYGGRWIAPRPSRIATLVMGYADGVPRTDRMRDQGEFRIGPQRAPVAGTVCMDLTMLDVTGREVEEGDEAVLFGDDPTAWEVADWAGTNGWEVVTNVGARVPRVFVREGRVTAVESRFLP